MTRQVPVTSTVVDKRTECRMIPITEPGTEREIEVPQNLYRQGSLVIETCKIKYVQSDAGDFTSGKACGVAILSISIRSASHGLRDPASPSWLHLGGWGAFSIKENVSQVCYDVNVPSCSTNQCGMAGGCPLGQSVCSLNQYNTQTVCPLSNPGAGGLGPAGLARPLATNTGVREDLPIAMLHLSLEKQTLMSHPML